MASRRLTTAVPAALTDPGTGVGNRLAWSEALRTERLRRARYRRPVVLMSVRTGGLAAARRRLGPAAADELLVATATILRRNLRDADVVARVSSNEFGVMLPETIADAMDALVARLHGAAAAWRGTDPALRLSLSIGWAVPEPFGDLHAAQRLADQRMQSERRGA